MPRIDSRNVFASLVVCWVILLSDGATARAQLITIGPVPTATPFYVADTVYVAGGPPPLTGPGAALLLPPAAIGLPPAPPGTYIVDAISSGDEAGDAFLFSVSPASIGAAGSPVAVETAIGSGPSHVFPGPPVPGGIPPEAAGDIFSAPGPLFGVPASSTPPVAGFPTVYLSGVSQVVDEFALGLNVAPAPGAPTDNLNGLMVRMPGPSVYYSLAAGGLGPAPFFPSDIILGGPGPGAVWAAAAALGLDIVGGPGSDDLDALIVHDWFAPGVYSPVDVVLFSLAPGSPTLAAIGATPADILAPPPFGVPGLPMIFMPAAALGLLPADDLDALDVVCAYPIGDANLNGIVDIFDVNLISENWGTMGPMGDANFDSIVDIFDVNVVSSNWGATAAWYVPPGPPVPEPATLVLAAFALACLIVVRRRAT